MGGTPAGHGVTLDYEGGTDMLGGSVRVDSRPGTAEKFLPYLDTLVTVPEELRSGARHAELLAL